MENYAEVIFGRGIGQFEVRAKQVLQKPEI